MRQDEAEKLARKLKVMFANGMRSEEHDMDALCDHILSGELRREIENAAYERVINKVAELSPRGAGKIQQAIRSLIQPPAQKENGK